MAARIGQRSHPKTFPRQGREKRPLLRAARALRLAARAMPGSELEAARPGFSAQQTADCIGTLRRRRLSAADPLLEFFRSPFEMQAMELWLAVTIKRKKNPTPILLSPQMAARRANPVVNFQATALLSAISGTDRKSVV